MSPRRRRWPWVGAVVLLLAIAVTAGGVGWQQREVASAWRDRAGELEYQRDAAVDRGDLIQTQLDEVALLLRISEADVAELERRIRALASEKAEAEDEVTTVRVERDVFAQLSRMIAAATDDLDTCVARLFELQVASTDAFNRTVAGEPVDVAPLNSRARETTALCDRARAAAARTSARAGQMVSP